MVVSCCFVGFQAGEANGKSPAGEEEVAKKQQQLDELTEKLENAQRAQKQLFLIVFQVRKIFLVVEIRQPSLQPSCFFLTVTNYDPDVTTTTRLHK